MKFSINESYYRGANGLINLAEVARDLAIMADLCRTSSPEVEEVALQIGTAPVTVMRLSQIK